MFERMFRRSCSACGGSIVWLTGEEARQDEELAESVAKASRWMGEPVQSAWRCTRSACGEAGFFGSQQSG